MAVYYYIVPNMRVAQKVFLCRCIEISFQSSFIENLGVILVLIPFIFGLQLLWQLMGGMQLHHRPIWLLVGLMLFLQLQQFGNEPLFRKSEVKCYFSSELG